MTGPEFIEWMEQQYKVARKEIPHANTNFYRIKAAMLARGFVSAGGLLDEVSVQPMDVRMAVWEDPLARVVLWGRVYEETQKNVSP